MYPYYTLCSDHLHILFDISSTDFLFVGFVFRSSKQLSESAVGLETHVNLMFLENSFHLF